MIDRTTGLLLAIVGTMLVALLLVMGMDIHRAARTGPRWRRRLVAAGIMLLATMGVAGCNSGPGPVVSCYVTAPVSAKQFNAAELGGRAEHLYDLALDGKLGADTLAVAAANIDADMDSLITSASDTERAEMRADLARAAGFLARVRALPVVGRESGLTLDSRWQQLAMLMDEARLAGSGRMGPYPFDQATQVRLQRELVAGDATLVALAGAGLLNAAEKELLAQELKYLYAQVSEKRPVEMQMATCYEPMMYLPGRDGLERLTARIDWLEKAAAERTLHPEALRASLGTIVEDCTLLNDPAKRGQMTPDELKQAAALTARAQKALAALAGR